MKPVYFSLLILFLTLPIVLSGCSGNGTTGQEVANYVNLQSDSGDYIGGSQTYKYSQSNAKIVVNATGGHLTITIDGDQKWSGDFQVPSNINQLQVGRYDNLQRYPFHDPVKGGLNWSGEGRGSNTVTGWFAIDKVTYENGILSAIDLRFEQHSEDSSAALHGQIHWKSTDSTTAPEPVNPPPDGLWKPTAGLTPSTGNYIYLQSDAGDYIGGGQSYTYTHANAQITVSATEGHLSVNIYGGEIWMGDFQTMNALNNLQLGYYGNLQHYPVHNPVKGGLNWSGEGRGNNTVTGWFAIDNVTYENGTLTAIDLRFKQHSEGASPALHGQIHWKLGDIPTENWQQTSGPTENRIYSIAIESTSQTIYAGTESGVYKSTIGSGSWVSLNIGLPTSYVSTVVIDPTNSQVIYAGTMYGVYKSVDGGATWNYSASAPFDSVVEGVVNSIAIDPNNSQVIYVGANGIFKSVDGGNSWNKVYTNDDINLIFVNSIAIDPTNSQVIYAGRHFGGVIKSVNGGETWNTISNGLPPTYIYMNYLAIDPSNTQTVYVATNGYGVYKSTNGGISWSTTVNSLKHDFVLSLLIDPLHPQTIYAGTYSAGLYKSTDGGGGWSAISTRQSPRTIWSFAIDTTQPRTIYAGTEEGKVLKGLLSN